MKKILLLIFLMAGCNSKDPTLSPLGNLIPNDPIPETTYAIAVYAEGLSVDSISLSLNDETTLNVNQNGVSFFSKKLKLNAPFEVNIQTQPTNRNCFIQNSVGFINGLSSDIKVKCSPVGSYYIGGPISGLDSGELQVSLGNFETTRISAGASTYAFNWYVGNGPITLAINNSGTSRSCKFSRNQSDSIVINVSNMNVNDLQINCTTALSNVVTMSGVISGITGSSLSISQSNGNSFSLNTDGSYNINGSFFEGQRFSLELKSANNRYCFFNNTNNHLFSYTPTASKTDVNITCIIRDNSNLCSKGTGELPATNGTISSVDCLKDKILYGGSFSLIGHQKGITKLETTTAATISEPAKIFDRIHGKINKIISDNNGGYFIAGLFNQVGDKKKRNLVRLDSRFMIDETFNIEVEAEVMDIDLSGNDLYVSGPFQNLIQDGQLYFRNALARISLVTSTPSIVAFSFPAATHSITNGSKVVTEVIGPYIYMSSTWYNPNISTILGLLGRRTGRVVYVINKSSGASIGFYKPTNVEDGLSIFWQDINNQTWYLQREVGMINVLTGLAHPFLSDIPYSTTSNFYLDGNNLYIYSSISGVKNIKKIDLNTLGTNSSSLFATVAITSPTSAVFNPTKACFFGSDVGGRKSIGCFNKADGTLLPFNPFPISQVLTTGIFEGEAVVANAQFTTATQTISTAAIDSITRTPILPVFSVQAGAVVNSIINDGTYFYLAGSFSNFGACTFCDSIARISASTSLVDTNWHPATNAFFSSLSSIDISGGFLFASESSQFFLYQMQLSNLNQIVRSQTPIYFKQVLSIGNNVLSRSSNSNTYSSDVTNNLMNWNQNIEQANTKAIKTSTHFYWITGSKINQILPNGVLSSTFNLGVTPLSLAKVTDDKICVLLTSTSIGCYTTLGGIFTQENSLTFNGPSSVTVFEKTGDFLFLSAPQSAPLQIPL